MLLEEEEEYSQQAQALVEAVSAGKLSPRTHLQKLLEQPGAQPT